MIVEGACKRCRERFDAHWSVNGGRMYPPCPYCKSSDVSYWSDESESILLITEDYDDED